MSGPLLCHCHQQEALLQETMRLVTDNKVIFSELKYVNRYRSQDAQTSFFR